VVFVVMVVVMVRMSMISDMINSDRSHGRHNEQKEIDYRECVASLGQSAIAE
jgi:hypothetical protein